MFLGLDLGTTNIKALLVDAAGRIAANASAPVPLRYVAEGGVEQDIEEIWSATLSAVRSLGESSDLSQVKAVGVSAQGGALQLLKGNGEPDGPVISWLDGRGRPYDEGMTRKLGHGWFAEHTGHGESATTVGQIARIRDEDPARVKPPSRIGFVGDVIVSRLCGNGAHDGTSLSLAMLYNPSLETADPSLLKMIAIAEDQLPRLVRSDTAAGGLTSEAAKAMHLPAGIPVSPAVHDQYAAALGANVTGDGDVMLGTGTAWVLLAAADKLVDPVIPQAFVCTHVIEGLYGQMLPLGNGGCCFGWVLDMLGLSDQSAEELDQLMASVPPGSRGLRFWPLLAATGGAGLKPNTRGRLMGLQLSHGPADVLRAVVEGLAFELARYLQFLQRGGIKARRLVMSGSAAVGRVTPQVVADVAVLPVACTEARDISALGAAMIARCLAEPNADLRDAAEAMSPPVRSVAPGPESESYQKLFAEYARALPTTSL